MNLRSITSIIILCLTLLSCKKNRCIEGDCVNGIGILKYVNNGIDSGEFKNGELTGLGKQIMGEGQFEGDIYIGEFSEGVYNGYGTYYHSNHDAKYIGLTKNGKRHGQGKVVFGENSIHGSKTFYGTWENGICEEYENYIQTSKNGEYVFYIPVKFMDSLTHHINYTSKIVNNIIHFGIELHEMDLESERVKHEDVEKIIQLINLGNDTIRYAINSMSNIKEFDELIPLKHVTIKYIAQQREHLDDEFRNWAMRLQYNPSDVKLDKLQSELEPILDEVLSMNEEFTQTQKEFMKKYNITFE